jgi:hypothetical protein
VSGHSHSTSVKTSSSPTLKAIFLVAALLLAVPYCNHKRDEAKAADISNCKNKDDEWVKIPAGFSRSKEGKCVEGVSQKTLPATPSRTVYVVQKVGPEETLHRFGEDGCVHLYLHGNWGDSPMGGKVSFLYKETGHIVLHDEPGTDHGASLPSGDYDICREEGKAWGVKIRQ